ncbi:MAG: histidine--tRNA ligase [Flavitalea sp.]
MSKPTVPQGTRDFGPETVRKRNFILNTIKGVFELYGFLPLETPAMENLDTLMGKYGEEGDKLIFRILNNGLGDPKNAVKARSGFENALLGKTDKNLTERALRYDLTIPFARYVAMNSGLLNFPFKRYQVQPVWRADRPQRGRYREFYQCDADVVGSKSLLNEVEFVNMYHSVFTGLKMNAYELRINSRKVLTGLAHKCGAPDKLGDITIAIDKLDKIGVDKVKEELISKGLNQEQVSAIAEYLNIDGTNQQKLQQAEALLGKNAEGLSGLEELKYITEKVEAFEYNVPLLIDFTLARGLNYYTGTIFEVKAPAEIQMGSIGGGGRYDDLTGLFGVPDIPGAGISFGVDRIYDVMEEMNLFPAELNVSTRAMFLYTGEKEIETIIKLMHALRNNSVSCELFSEPQKIEKQFKYAEKKNIPFVVTCGTSEIENRNVKIKDIRNGNVSHVDWVNLVQFDFN